ncbi:MAG: hypothetical protein NZM07_08395 [Elioraea sp.]|nr:hypothetical protein [Elioraea sp.]
MTTVNNVLKFLYSKIWSLNSTMYEFNELKNDIRKSIDYTDYDVLALFGPRADDAHVEQDLIFGEGKPATNDILLAVRALIGGDWGLAFA